MIRVGDIAPDFSAPSSTGAAAPNSSLVRLSERRGRWVILYFFPKAFTAG
ncbi:MAG: redoxin domain-containing protein [Polyangiaceae bacterium]|nr:redoxin domain-containing protein [Polyangiaceae bacterium]